MTWGGAYSGGDSSAVQDQLKNVQQIKLPSQLSLPSLETDLLCPGVALTMEVTGYAMLSTALSTL